MVLREGWYSRDVPADIDLDSAGICEWRIEGTGVYVGKAGKLSRRIRAYPNNVRRLIIGLPWHGDPKRQYRPVHYALRRAHDEGMRVSVAVLEICDSDLRTRKHLEDTWIARRRAEEAQGGPKVLNSA